MSLERWRGKSWSSSNLSISLEGKSASHKVREVNPLKRIKSTSDIITPTYYDDVRDYYRYRPWQQLYTNPRDELRYFNVYRASRYYPRLYYPTRRELFYDLAPKTSYSFPRPPYVNWESSIDPVLFCQPSFSPYRTYPYRYWLKPSLYDSNFYNSYSYKPFYRSSSYYYPALY